MSERALGNNSANRRPSPSNSKVLEMPHYRLIDVLKGRAVVMETQGIWKAVADKRRQEVKAS